MLQSFVYNTIFQVLIFGFSKANGKNSKLYLWIFSHFGWYLVCGLTWLSCPFLYKSSKENNIDELRQIIQWVKRIMTTFFNRGALMNWTKYENIQRPFFFSLLIIKGLQKKKPIAKKTYRERKKDRKRESWKRSW